MESQNSISRSIKAQAETLGFSAPLLVTTADHPLLTVEMIDEFVRNADGDIIEGNETEVKRQRDVWTFGRTMGADDPNWQLIATGE